MKANMDQVNPHASQAECERLLAADAVHGCAKPFKLVVSADGSYTPIKWQYG
jgi:hypothetical protein